MHTAYRPERGSYLSAPPSVPAFSTVVRSRLTHTAVTSIGRVASHSLAGGVRRCAD